MQFGKKYFPEDLPDVFSLWDVGKDRKSLGKKRSLLVCCFSLLKKALALGE